MTAGEAMPWTPADALATLSRLGERPAVLDVSGETVRTVTGAALVRLVGATADRMAGVGVGPGDIVAIWARNSPGWIAAGLACAHLGAVLAPADVTAPADEAREHIDRIGARFAFVDAGSEDALGAGLTVLGIDQSGAAEVPAPAVDLAPDAPMAMFRTSGTTGTPKTFFLSRRNIAAGVAAVVDWDGVRESDRILLPLPMHHVFPWITAALSALTIGATIIFPESPTGPHIASALRLTRPTVLIGVPRLFEAMLDGIAGRIRGMGAAAGGTYAALLASAIWLRRVSGQRFGAFLMTPFRRMIAPQIRLMVSGGAPLKDTTAETIEAYGWDMRTGYGLSETAAAFSGTFFAKRAGSVGQPIGDGRVRIEHPNADGIGEILLSGPTVFSGYLDNPEANASAFDTDGYFRTGDLGRVDEDGFLYITGRAKEVIVLAGGDNIYPEDVEERYLASSQIGEIGVLDADGALVAVIVPNTAEIARAGVLDPNQAIKVAIGSIAKSLPSTWRLAGFALIREPLPRTRLGKLRRFQLPDLYRQAKSGGAGASRPLTATERAWVEAPPRAAVWALLGREHGARPFDLDSHMQLDLGLDSFGWMTLAVAIQEATGARLEAADIAAIDTVRDLLHAVTDKASASAPPSGPTLEMRLAEDRTWLAPRTGTERLLGGILFGLNRFLMTLLFRLRVEGREHIPNDGPVLICPNHTSDLDPSAVAAALPGHALARIAWAADKVRVFGSPARRALCRAAHAFPVDETMPMVSVELAIESLGQGSAQVWFAEGWRSADGTLQKFQAGAGRIIEAARPTVIPAVITGTLEAWPRERALPRPHPVRIIFGPPIPAADLVTNPADNPKAYEEIAARLHDHVAALAQEHGADIA